MAFPTPSDTVPERTEVSERKSVPQKPSKFSDAERGRRSARMKAMNEAGVTGAHFGKLGGRPRRGESAEQAKERRAREREAETLKRLTESMSPRVISSYKPERVRPVLTADEESVARAFLVSHGAARPRGAKPRRTF